MTEEILAMMMRETRLNEHRARIDALISWRDVDMACAREWRSWGRADNIDTREDVRRNVRCARQWNWLLIRLKIRARAN